MAPGRSRFGLWGPRAPSGRQLAGPAAGLLIPLLWGRARVCTVQLLKHRWWERTRAALRAPTQPYLSQHLLLSFAPWQSAPGCRGVCRCGASLEEWCELYVLVWCPVGMA